MKYRNLSLSKNKISGIIRLSIFGFVSILAFFLVNIDYESLRAVEVIIILMTSFFLIIFAWFLKQIAYELNVQADYLEAYREGIFWTLKPIFKVSKNEMKRISVRKSNSLGDDILIHLNNDDIVKFKPYGLELLNEKEWLKPNFNEYLWSHPQAQRPFIIAYNLSKLYNIPFESEFIRKDL